MLVERYQQHDESGAVFPAIIVGKNGKANRYVIADGIHRYEAKRQNHRPMVWAYVFPYDTDIQFRSVSRTANAILNGRDNSEAERLIHAAAFVDQGVDRKTAAYQCGVSPSRLGTYITAQTARQRFADLGIGHRAYADLSDKAISDLSATLADGAVRKALDMIRGGVGINTVLKVVRQAKSEKKTETSRAEAQVEALTVLAEIETGGRAAGLLKGRKDTLRMRVLGCIKALEEVEASGRAEEFANELAHIRRLCGA